MDTFFNARGCPLTRDLTVLLIYTVTKAMSSCPFCHRTDIPSGEYDSRERFGPGLRLSTSCSRFPKKLPVISQNVAQKLLKISQKLLFVTKVAQKLLKKEKRFLVVVALFLCLV